MVRKTEFGMGSEDTGKRGKDKDKTTINGEKKGDKEV